MLYQADKQPCHEGLLSLFSADCEEYLMWNLIPPCTPDPHRNRSFLPSGIMAEKKVPNEAAIDVASGEVESQGFDQLATKKLLRKLDWHVIPFMSLIYL